MCVGADATSLEIEVKRKAFIVEDAPDAQATLRALLEAADFEVLACATTEHEASAWLDGNEGSWDLVTVDLLLAEGSGFAVLRRYAMSERAGQVVVFSGFISDTVRERCVALGAHAVFSKGESRLLAEFLRVAPRRAAE
jgi:DNA-binding NarL/FixJ family response regulator